MLEVKDAYSHGMHKIIFIELKVMGTQKKKKKKKKKQVICFQLIFLPSKMARLPNR